MKKITIPQSPSIQFNVGHSPIIKLERGKFFWKGKEIKDVHMIYERFSQWMRIAESELLNKSK